MSNGAGRFRKRITIQTNAQERDGPGWEDNWQDVATTRAEILPATGGEAFRRGVERGTQFYRITIRYRDGISTDMRVMWGDKELAIRSAGDPLGTRRELLIVAEYGVPT